MRHLPALPSLPGGRRGGRRADFDRRHRPDDWGPVIDGDSRAALYGQLERIAGALKRIEPHSPVPYLLERCVKFGRVPVAELARIIREAGGCRLPVTWSDESESVSSGGYSAGFEFFSRDQPPASLRLTWSYGPPDDWGPVIDWYVAAWDDLRTCVAAAEIPIAG